MNLRDTYNKIAQDWHQDHERDDWWLEATERFAALFSRGATILDAGCAGGVKSRYLVEKGFQVTGIDLAENFIEIAKKEVPQAEFRVLDIRDIASLPKEFDGIFLQAVLLHFPKKEVSDILKNMLTKLRPGGFLYVAVKEKREGQEEEEVKTEHDYGYEYQRFFSYFSQKEVEEVLKSLGMKIVFSEVQSNGRARWIQIIAQKIT